MEAILWVGQINLVNQAFSLVDLDVFCGSKGLKNHQMRNNRFFYHRGSKWSLFLMKMTVYRNQTNDGDFECLTVFLIMSFYDKWSLWHIQNNHCSKFDK